MSEIERMKEFARKENAAMWRSCGNRSRIAQKQTNARPAVMARRKLVLNMIQSGMSLKQVAENLNCTITTVKHDYFMAKQPL